VLLTFDNLGEASELERGTWPNGEPLGRHPSVTRALPRLLDELDLHGLTATFFVEGINCELYPDALRQIAARGHELGVHGWRHETWPELSPSRERHLLTAATDAFRALGFPARGFRPPGGGGTAETASLLGDHGYTWWSPSAGAGDGAGRPLAEGSSPASSGLAEIPFDWDLVDAYHLMERFADLRRSRGDRAEPMTAVELGDHLAGRLQPAVVAGETEVLIMHPFLMLDEAWFDQVRRLLGIIAGR